MVADQVPQMAKEPGGTLGPALSFLSTAEPVPLNFRPTVIRALQDYGFVFLLVMVFRRTRTRSGSNIGLGGIQKVLYFNCLSITGYITTTLKYCTLGRQ